MRLKKEIEDMILKTSIEYRESQYDQITIGKTKHEAIVASLHCQVGYMAGYRQALKDVEKNKTKKPYFTK